MRYWYGARGVPRGARAKLTSGAQGRGGTKKESEHAHTREATIMAAGAHTTYDSFSKCRHRLAVAQHAHPRRVGTVVPTRYVFDGSEKK
jgi:hypothetical protein